jgi:hypothetical protein
MADRDLKVVFRDGNTISLPNSSCNCPNSINVDVTDMMPGKKYTVFIKNLNSTPVRTFPESYSFIAEASSKTLSFYYQFS